MPRKLTKCPPNMPNAHKTKQMTTTYSGIFHCKTLQKFAQTEIFGLKIMPSGYPGFGLFFCLSSVHSSLWWPKKTVTTNVSQNWTVNHFGGALEDTPNVFFATWISETVPWILATRCSTSSTRNLCHHLPTLSLKHLHLSQNDLS
jgi:hypothetical protein